METTKNEKMSTKERLGVKTGLFTAVGLMLYFMIMKWLHLVQYVELRFFNILILMVGVFYALNSYRHDRHIEKISYLKGLSVGFITSLIAAGAFSFFMFFYLRYFDSGFLQMIQQDAWFGAYLNPSGASFAVFLETASSGSIFTFICMQFLKNEPYSQSYHPFKRDITKRGALPFSGDKTLSRS